MRHGLWLVLLVAGCGPDFRLEERRFACDPAVAGSCGTGWSCQPDGFCARRDGGLPGDSSVPPDARPDSARELCGNGVDDDMSGARDCRDPDCPTCGGGMRCCASGDCAVSCP